jgi:ABC-type dipeptide/oligopeptide/nickel transport system permease component
MWRHITLRLATSLLVIVLLSILTFVIMHILPGDPALAALNGQPTTPAILKSMRHAMGLDKPLYMQYLDWVGGLLHGDFGTSLRTQLPVTTEIGETLPATLQLTLGGLLVAIFVGIPLGVTAAVRANTLVDWLATGIATIGVALPGFLLGLVLIFVFSFDLGWFPASGTTGIGSLVLPSITLGFGAAAIIARITRTSLVEQMQEEYVRVVRAKGVRESRVILGHALRNALIPVLTTVGLLTGGLLSGAVIIEAVFSRPGLGRLTLQAVQARDFTEAQALVFLFGVFYVGVNTLVDIAYALIDPRIRYR